MREKRMRGFRLFNFLIFCFFSVIFLIFLLRFEVAELNNALACCAVSSTSERKEGLKALYAIVSNEKYIDPLDLKRITERLNLLISEGSHKVG